MQFFVYFTVNKDEPMRPPNPEGMAKMSKFMQESFASGKIVATGQMPQSSTHIRLDDGQFSVSDGPFIEGKDLIPGFTIIQTDTREQALEWTKSMCECMGSATLKLALLSATSPEDIKA